MIFDNIHDEKNNKVNMTAKILGTKVRVISWIWVTAWKSDMRIPTVMPTSKRGEARRRAMVMAFWAMEIASDGVMIYTPKLFTSEPTIRYQPSTSTKSSSLNGSDTMMGGSIIIPMDNRTLATTMSIIRKGRKRTKPI